MISPAPSGDGRTLKGVYSDRGPDQGFPLAPFGWSGTPETVPMMADGPLLRSGGETWGPVSPDNVHETGVSPQWTFRISVETAEAQLVERTRGKTLSRPGSELLCPSGVGENVRFGNSYMDVFLTIREIT